MVGNLFPFDVLQDNLEHMVAVNYSLGLEGVAYVHPLQMGVFDKHMHKCFELAHGVVAVEGLEVLTPDQVQTV